MICAFVGDVFAGIGKGALNGLIIGGGISLTIVGGLGFGVTSVLGSIIITYGMSVVANMCEVGVLQVKKVNMMEIIFGIHSTMSIMQCILTQEEYWVED